MTMDAPASPDTMDGLRQKLKAALDAKDLKLQACYELELKLKQLQQERDQLAYDYEKLLGQNAKLLQSDPSRRVSGASTKDLQESSRRLSKNDDGPSEDVFYQQNKRLQNEIRRLKEELIKVELEKEDYRLKSNLLLDDLDKVTQRNEDLRDKAEQARRLQDELDEHKHISGKVMSYEQMIDNLVKKNNELKTELKNLEDKNLSHVQDIVKLEQENEQLKVSINQVGIYRKQLNEAQLKLSEETHRADKAEVDLIRIAERFESAKKENEKLYEVTNQLMISKNANKADNQMSTVDALGQRLFESVDLKEGPSPQLATALQPDDMYNSMSTSVIELKEKIARLEMENQLLESRLSTNPNGNKNVLGGMLEEASEKCKKLENDNRQARKKIMVLESNLKDLMSGQTSRQSGSMNQIFGPQSSGQGSSDNTLVLIKRVEDLQRSLYQKEQELRDAELKYKKNIQKAKELAKALQNGATGGPATSQSVSLHPSCISSVSSFTSNSLDEMNLLRQQLRDREERLIALEQEFYEFRCLKEVHERFILSAFYGLTTSMQWKNAEKRLEQTNLTSPPNTANSSFNNHFSPAKETGHQASFSRR